MYLIKRIKELLGIEPCGYDVLDRFHKGEKFEKLTQAEISTMVQVITREHETAHVYYTSRGSSYVYTIDVITSRRGREVINRMAKLPTVK